MALNGILKHYTARLTALKSLLLHFKVYGMKHKNIIPTTKILIFNVRHYILITTL